MPLATGEAHVADQLANFKRHLRSAAATSRLPSPERTKTRTMPMDNSLRLHDHQGTYNAQHNPIQASKNQEASRFGDFLRSTWSWWRTYTANI
jgi:hypothetical protein